MVLIGDGAHNFIDGVLIASAYIVDTHLGFATTITVMLHEIPQEIGDFAVLLHSGYSKIRALFWNFLSALMALLGAGTVLFLQGSVEGIEAILLPLTAGNFLYIALADLIPALHKESRPAHAVLQLLCIGFGALLLFTFSSHGEHADEDAGEHQELHDATHSDEHLDAA
jgi:zinc and cadmium transporter